MLYFSTSLCVCSQQSKKTVQSYLTLLAQLELIKDVLEENEIQLDHNTVLHDYNG